MTTKKHMANMVANMVGWGQRRIASERVQWTPRERRVGHQILTCTITIHANSL